MMNRIYIEPPPLVPRTAAVEDWKAEQLSKIYEAIARHEYMNPNGVDVNPSALGQILLALVKLTEVP